MNTFLWGLLLTFFALPIFSQTPVSGVINHYAKILDIDLCQASLTVGNGSDFQSGELVLLIQMKGATINESNSSSFGNIDNIGSTGYFEKNEILSVSGNNISLKYEIANQYDLGSSVQIVGFPKHDQALVNGELSAKPWDGSSGGVLVLEASNLDLQANINVTGSGFRGATKVLVNSDCDFFTDADSYHYTTTNWRGSPKGEGIAEIIAGKEHGRGAQSNGGGGGNDHNSGGGGGANTVSGGVGGKQSASGFGCDGDYAGKGGKPCPEEPERLFMGGGGGAGHFDDTGAGSSGANGGGIAIIIAETILANGFAIKANGNNALIAQGDGAGGGGGGGTIVLMANTIQGSLLIEAKGGKGGDAINTSGRCNGVGGGGSGGRFLSNISFGNPLVNLSEGQPGDHQGSTSECSGATNGAEAGQVGLNSPFIDFPESTVIVQPLAVLSQPSAITVCINDSLSVGFILAGNYLTYQWQVFSNGIWNDINSFSGISGEKSPILTIDQASLNLDGKLLRCIATSPCYGDIISNEILLTVLEPPIASFTIVPLGNSTYQFQNNSTNGQSYLWEFGDGQTSTEFSPSHTYQSFGDFVVTLTVFGECGEAVATETLDVDVAPNAAFSFQNNGLCAPQVVEFENLSSANSSSYEWYFEGGDPATSNLVSPTITYLQAGQFDVVLIASNGVGSDTMVLENVVEVGDVPTAQFDLTVSNLHVEFNNLSLNATNGYTWDFGDGNTSSDVNPSHDYAIQGTYQVTLTAYNDCGASTFSISVPTGSLPLALFTADQSSGCTPLEINFANQSTGSNIVDYYWEFPGGEPAFSIEENPIVTYNEEGSFPVMLTVTNLYGSHTQILQDFVIVTQTPFAAFDYSIQGNEVQFVNNSENADYYFWEFGDGTSSQAVSPLHVYEDFGDFNVMLTAGSLNCGSAVSNTIYLQPLAIGERSALGFGVYPNPFHAGFTLNFNFENWAPSTMRLLDLNGKVVAASIIISNRWTYDARSLGTGVYILEIELGNKLMRSKVVKI